jgi:cell division protein FtsL
MDSSTLIVLLIVAFAIVGIVAWFVSSKHRTRQLRQQFGSEYDRAVSDYGPRRAETELQARQRRVEKLAVRALTPEERDRFMADWRTTQSRFVDDPAGAIHEADRLVGDLMEARNYPVKDFEQRVADISVHHARVADHYRAAHAIAVESRDGRASTEDLRRAMVHNRSLFEDLLGLAPEREGRDERVA